MKPFFLARRFAFVLIAVLTFVCTWNIELKTTTALGGKSVLRLSLPNGTYVHGNPDPWLSTCWLLNITGLSGALTLRIEDVSPSVTSYDTHLIVALNDAAYNNLVSLSVNATALPKTAFRNGIPTPYNISSWLGGDVYPTWFNDTLINLGTILPEEYVDVTVSLALSNATGVRIHFDAYGSSVSPPPPSVQGEITENPLTADCTVLFWPSPQHDIAVTELMVSKTIVSQGYCLNVTVTIENQGGYTETFNVTAYYNGTAITLPSGKNYTTITLTSGNYTTITFTWNTTDVPKGDYTVRAYATPVLDETDTADNTKIADSTVTVLSPGHDVAIKDIAPSRTVVGQNYSLSIHMTTRNYGSFAETFNVTTYYTRVCETIPNGDFEKDPAGTSYNDISDWNHSSDDVYGGVVVENLEVVDDYCFNGNKSLYSYVKSDGKKFQSRVCQYLWTENPISTFCDWVSLWMAGDGYTTSSRYHWHIGLYLTDGTNKHYEILRCDCWGDEEGCSPDHYDYYNATETGADGRTWKRYTRRIPDNIDKSNLTITICHYQCSWDWTAASSWYRIDSIYLSDFEGNLTCAHIIEIEIIANLPPGEETTLVFMWNTTGVAKGNYTIKAKATPIPGETDLTDNTLTDGWVMVVMFCDFDGDGIVDVSDIAAVSRRYGCACGHPCYEPNYDIVGDDCIIDVSDIAEVARHFGEADP